MALVNFMKKFNNGTDLKVVFEEVEVTSLKKQNEK